MNKEQQQNLFAGATGQQLKDIEVRTNIEKEYVKFCHANPNLDMEVYVNKYNELKCRN